MTTVLAYATGSAAWMAADTRTNIYDRPIRGWARKVMRLPAGDAEVLLGICGHAGVASKVQQAWLAMSPDAPPADPDDQQLWADEVTVALTVPNVEAGLVDENGHMDGYFLLAFPGAVWTLQHHLAVPHPDRQAAVGTGEAAAMGALEAFLQCDVPPARAVEQAVEVAVQLDRWSGLPLQLEQIEP